MSSIHSLSNAPPGAPMGYRLLTSLAGTPTLTPGLGTSPITTGVVEFHPSGALTSIYAVEIAQTGEYSIVWDNGGVLIADDTPALNQIGAIPVTLDLTQAIPTSNTAQT